MNKLAVLMALGLVAVCGCGILEDSVKKQDKFAAIKLDGKNFTPKSEIKDVVAVFAKDKKSETLKAKIAKLPENCGGIKVELQLKSKEKGYGEVVFQLFVEQEKLPKEVKPLWTYAAVPAKSGTVELDAYYPVDDKQAVTIKLNRVATDNRDTTTEDVTVKRVIVTPQPKLATPIVAQEANGYNSWSFIQSFDGKLVCAYSRGKRHTTDEVDRGIYAKVSTDDGKTWGEEVTVINSDRFGECAEGIGLDSNGAVLLWARCQNQQQMLHDLYRTTDGKNFEKIASLKLNPAPMQITNVFSVPGVGLMSLWFAGDYKQENGHSWGTLVSTDNGATWTQNTIESDLPKKDWPTEQSAICLGDGKILAIGRREYVKKGEVKAQIQLQSEDNGKTWRKLVTNIFDIRESTPSLIYNKWSGVVSVYYFERHKGVLKRRSDRVEKVWNSAKWSDPEAIALGSRDRYHAGNVNATTDGSQHFCTIYSGNEKNCSILVIPADKPRK